MFSAMRKCKWYLITEGSGWSEGFLYISKYPWVIHINHVPYITTFTADSFSNQEHRPQAQVSFASLIRILSTNNVQTPSRLLVCVFDLKRCENLISEALVKRDRHQKACHRISVYPWHKELSVCRPRCRSPRDKKLCRFEDFISL